VTAARELTARWKEDYNGIRQHSSLGYQTQAEFAAAVPAPANACVSTPAAHAARDEALLFPNPCLHNGWYRNQCRSSI
jgi:hypothetical protein